MRAVTGALLHRMGAYLLHRGLATLPVGVRRQPESARQVAGWLARHRLVEAVNYPGFDGDPRGLIRRQMRGRVAMISVLLRRVRAGPPVAFLRNHPGAGSGDAP